MGIARRKAGQVVRCPRCAGQVVVPAGESVLKAPAENPTPLPPQPPASSLFDQENFSRLLGPAAAPPRPPPVATFEPPAQPASHYDAEPLHDPVELRGVFLTPGLLTLAGVLIIVLMGAAFFVGWMVGRA